MGLRGVMAAVRRRNGARVRSETEAAVVSTAAQLLQSSHVTLTPEPPSGGDAALSVPVELADRRLWLSVSGRSRTEPFGDGDRVLLGALASVAAVALANADLYAQAEEQHDDLSLIVRSLGEGVCAIDKDGRITFLNQAGARMLGLSQSDDPDPEGAAVQDVETPRFLLDPALRAIDAGQNVVTDDIRFDRLDGSRVHVSMTAAPVVDDPQAPSAVVVFHDTSERRAFEEQLARRAFQDPLTHLANRRLLLDHLDHALLQAERTGGRVAVLFGDLDRFKIVNDNLGHQIGDEFLGEVADRLRRAVRPGDTLARFGGDEFVILLEGISTPDDAHQVASRVLESLREPIRLSDGNEITATMSIGMALSGLTGSTRDDLLHDADVAMYRAKERGRGGQVTLFDPARMGNRPAGRLDLDTALHSAVQQGEVEVYFQPLISLADQRIVGAEALVRWDHPKHGILTPAHFIDLAEGNGAIVPIGRAVLEQACHRARAWHDALGDGLGISVNLSARQFQAQGLEEHISHVLATTGIKPSLLCLEIAESLAMLDVEKTSSILTGLHQLGVRLAIDDFGTGHSSLGYLARFPVDVIKIDQSFVRDIDHDPVKSAIVSAVVALSEAIGATTVVEGVETLPELEQVRELGCDVAQGFYFSRPLPAGSFEELVAAGFPSADQSGQRWGSLSRLPS